MAVKISDRMDMHDPRQMRDALIAEITALSAETRLADEMGNKAVAHAATMVELMRLYALASIAAEVRELRELLDPHDHAGEEKP